MVPARSPISSTMTSNERLRSATDIEKNSLCLPATNTPSMPRSSTQWRRLRRKPASSTDRSAANGISAAAQMPFIWVRAKSLASLRRYFMGNPCITHRHHATDFRCRTNANRLILGPLAIPAHGTQKAVNNRYSGAGCGGVCAKIKVWRAGWVSSMLKLSQRRVALLAGLSVAVLMGSTASHASTVSWGASKASTEAAAPESAKKAKKEQLASRRKPGGSSHFRRTGNGRDLALFVQGSLRQAGRSRNQRGQDQEEEQVRERQEEQNGQQAGACRTGDSEWPPARHRVSR